MHLSLVLKAFRSLISLASWEWTNRNAANRHLELPGKFAPTCTRHPKRPKPTCTNSRPHALFCELRTGTNLHQFAPPRGGYPSGAPSRGWGVQIRVGLEPAEFYWISQKKPWNWKPEPTAGTGITKTVVKSVSNGNGIEFKNHLRACVIYLRPTVFGFHRRPTNWKPEPETGTDSRRPNRSTPKP